MSILSLHRPHHDPSGHAVARVALPLAGVVAGTAAGFALAAITHRSRPIGRDSLELAPDGSAVEFHEGGVRVSRRGGEDDRETTAHEAAVVAEVIAAGGSPGLGAAGIRPTFEVEAELAREVDAAAGDVDAGRPREVAAPGSDREPVLSAPRA